MKALAAAAVLALLATTPAMAQATQTAPKPGSTAPAPAASGTTAAKPAIIDINSASREELTALKGIGPARAEAIVKGRPYRGKDELVSKNIIPESVYADIREQIVARQK